MKRTLELKDIFPKLKQQATELKSVEAGQNTPQAFTRRWKVTPAQMRENLTKIQGILDTLNSK